MKNNKLKGFEKRKKNIQDIWLLSYVDMMTLLAILFILFFSLAYFSDENGTNKTIKALRKGLAGDETIVNKEEKELTQLMQKLQKSLGTNQPDKKNLNGVTSNINASTTGNSSASYASPTGNMNIHRPSENIGNITITITENIIAIRFSQPVLFDTGKADLKASGIKTLDRLGDLFAEIKAPIIVEGHTDSIPIKNSEYPSNWHLSFERSYRIIDYFTTKKHLNPKRLTAIGYADNKPITNNATEAGRGMNRRIELKIILPANRKLQKTESLFVQ